MGAAARQPDEGLRVAVRVTPRAGRNAIVGAGPDESGRNRLLVKVAAAPADGAANEAVVMLIADAFQVPRSHVSMIRGDTAREKLLIVRGNTAALEARLAQIQRSLA